MSIHWAWRLILLLLGLCLLLAGWLAPAHLRGVDAEVLRLAGRRGPALSAQGQALVAARRLGAAQMLALAGRQAGAPGGNPLSEAVAAAARQAPDSVMWGADTFLGRLFTAHAGAATAAEPFTPFLMRPENNRVALAYLRSSAVPAVQELLRCRDLTNTVLLPPPASAAGQVFDVALAECGLLLDTEHVSPGLSAELAALAAQANRGGDSRPLEQALLDFLSLGQRFNWDQLAAFTEKIPSATALRELTAAARRAGDGLPVLFTAVQTVNPAEIVAGYAARFPVTGLPDLTSALAFGPGGMQELAGRGQRFYQPDWRTRLTTRDPFGAVHDYAAEWMLIHPRWVLAVKWLGYWSAGFLLALALGLGRRRVSWGRRPKRFRALGFSLFFLLAVLLLSEPFLLPATVAAPDAAAAGADLTAVMQLALGEERRMQEQLLQQLDQARTTVEEQQTLAAQRAQENEKLLQRQTALQQAQDALQQQFALAQTNLAGLNARLQDAGAQARQAKDQLAAVTAEAQKQSATNATLQQQIEDWARKYQLALEEKQQLSNQLQTVEAASTTAAERVNQMQQQVQTERVEKARLAGQLQTAEAATTAAAERANKMQQQVQAEQAEKARLAENLRLLTLRTNAFFSELMANRLQATLTAARAGAPEAESKMPVVLATDGTGIAALGSAPEMLLTPANPGTNGLKFTGVLGSAGSGANPVNLRALSFHALDPRLVLLPLNAEEAKQAGGRIYHLAAGGAAWQKVLVVGANGQRGSEGSFLPPATPPGPPPYLKLDRNTLSKLAGETGPARGDWVFGHNGELLGVMVNDNYGLPLTNLSAAATLNLGSDTNNPDASAVLTRLREILAKLPPDLQ